MNIFIRKLKAIERLEEQVDNYVWNVFKQYIKINKICFNSPDDWSMEGDRVYFHGSDGCMGCYDKMSIGIPIKYFENPDHEFELLKKELKDQKLKDDKALQANRKKQDLITLKKLKEKYDQ